MSINASFDVVASSLFFHHLMPDKKCLAPGDRSRVLKPYGVLPGSDRGKPINCLNLNGFLLGRCLDGFEATRENVEGKLPTLVKQAGF